MNETRIPAKLRRLVRRPVVGEDGKPRGTRDIPLKEVLDWAESDTTVVIITVDGQRFRADKPEDAATAGGAEDEAADEETAA